MENELNMFDYESASIQFIKLVRPYNGYSTVQY